MGGPPGEKGNKGETVSPYHLTVLSRLQELTRRRANAAIFPRSSHQIAADFPQVSAETRRHNARSAETSHLPTNTAKHRAELFRAVAVSQIRLVFPGGEKKMHKNPHKSKKFANRSKIKRF